jgi:DNA replication protein DnaC
MLQNLPRAVAEVFANAYPGLTIQQQGTGEHYWLDMGALDANSRALAELDIKFLAANPAVPLENICARLDTYQPRNESQELLVRFCQRLLRLDDASRGAGLYMWGDAGIGKSHVAVSMAKLFMQSGLEPRFMVADQFSFGTHLELESGQVWIIDDLNTGYGLGSRLFKNVVRSIHEKGGRMFITSNKPYDQLMHEMFVGEGEAERMRYEDRTKGMFKILHVTGESWRQETAWYNE